MKAHKEALRVLKKGGTYIFASWDELKTNVVGHQADITLKNFFPFYSPTFYSIP